MLRRAFLAGLLAWPLMAQNPAGIEFFEKRIRPVLASKCYACHSAAAKPLMGRRLVDSAAAVYIGHLLLQQAAFEPNAEARGTSIMDLVRLTALRDRKKQVARRFITIEMPKVALNCQMAQTGDRTPLEQYAAIAGPVPAKD